MTEPDAPSRTHLLLMIAAGAVALGIGWVIVYAAYRYLASGWQ